MELWQDVIQQIKELGLKNGLKDHLQKFLNLKSFHQLN